MFRLRRRTQSPAQAAAWRRRRPRSSRQVLLRMKDTRDLRASVGALERDTVEGVGAKLAPVLAEGERLPDFALALDLVVRRVRVACDRLKQAAERPWRRRAAA